MHPIRWKFINLKRQVYDGQATIGNGNPSGQGKRLKGTKISYKTFMPRILGTTINETYMGHDWVFSCLP